MVRKFSFKRGKSLSEGKIPAMDKVDEKKRAAMFPEPELPVGEFARQAINNLPKQHLEIFKKLVYRAPFEQFQKLPEKLRRIIIRMLFDGDHEVRLRVQYRDGQYKREDFGFPPPATFYVNKEFRDETRKHYYFFSQIQAFQNANVAGIPEQPFCYCINPKLDNISIGFQSLWRHDFSLFVKAAFKEIPECMRAIRVLEIVNVSQASFVLTSTKEKDQKTVEKFLRDNLTRFHYLKEIRFVLNHQEVIKTVFVDSWKERVKKSFQKEHQRWPHCSIPKIICTSPQVTEAMKYLSLEHRP